MRIYPDIGVFTSEGGTIQTLYVHGPRLLFAYAFWPSINRQCEIQLSWNLVNETTGPLLSDHGKLLASPPSVSFGLVRFD